MNADAPLTLLALLRNERHIDSTRWRRMMGMTLCATLIATVLLIFRVPLLAYAPYVVLMAAQRDLVSSITLCVSALAAIAVGVGLSLLAYLVDIDEPALRLPAMALLMFTAMYLSRVPRTGALFFLTGYILVVTQTLADQIGDAEALTHLLLWLSVVALSACGTAALAEALWGRSRTSVFTEGLRQHAQRAIARLTGAPCDIAGITVRDLSVMATGLGKQAVGKLAAVLQIEQLAALRGNRASEAPWSALAHRVGIAAHAPVPRDSIDAVPVGDDDSTLHSAVLAQIELFEGTRPAPVASSVGVATRRTRAVDMRFAFKATLAAMACYAIYSGLDWPGIRTSLITCFFVAMNSTGETIQKLSLRITGALIGGLLAGTAIVFVFPWADDIGGFAMVFALGTLFCAWAITANPLIAYAGQQITLAFYLGMLQDTGPTDDLTVLRDRLVGVLLGNLAMTLVFATLWPVPTLSAAKIALADVARRRAAIFSTPSPATGGDVIADAVALEDAARLIALSAFDEGKMSGRRYRRAEFADAMNAAVAWSNAWLTRMPAPDVRLALAERFHAFANALDPVDALDAHARTDIDNDSIPPAFRTALDTLAREIDRGG